jgi:hypothetical protein
MTPDHTAVCRNRTDAGMNTARADDGEDPDDYRYPAMPGQRVSGHARFPPRLFGRAAPSVRN